jgi:hypothetical protein
MKNILCAFFILLTSFFANAGDAVSIRFNAETKCDYSREAKRDVEGPKVATDTSVGSMISKVTTTKVITTVVEYFWIVQSSWSVEIFRGTGITPADVIVLKTRSNAKYDWKISFIWPRKRNAFFYKATCSSKIR